MLTRKFNFCFDGCHCRYDTLRRTYTHITRLFCLLGGPPPPSSRLPPVLVSTIMLMFAVDEHLLLGTCMHLGFRESTNARLPA
jgi:hypothetical protein